MASSSSGQSFIVDPALDEDLEDSEHKISAMPPTDCSADH